jgi:DNA primase
MIGTALSPFQIGVLCRYAKEFYLLSDGDEGGKKSINNSMKIYEEYDLKNKGISFIPVILPDGLDPDDFVKQFGRNELVNLMIKSKEQCNNTSLK